MKKRFKYFTLIIVVFHFANIVYGQDADIFTNHKWGVKIGLTQIRYEVKDEPITGSRGMGCSFSNILEKNLNSYGGKLGIFYQLSLNKKSSLIFGPEILFTGSEKGYYTSLNCSNRLVSDSQGSLKFQNFTFFLPLVFRQETSFFDMFFEIGGYHDLTLGSTTEYIFTTSRYLDDNYQPMLEPSITNGTESLNGANYGLIFGLGNGDLFKSHHVELRAQYYLGLSETLPLGPYRYVRQSGIDISLNYRF